MIRICVAEIKVYSFNTIQMAYTYSNPRGHFLYLYFPFFQSSVT
jgi:hypothetical protein